MIPGASVSSVWLLVQAILVALIALSAMHRLQMLARLLRYRNHRPLLENLPAHQEQWPRVTVQLPIYNERFVVTRLLDAVAQLDYPRDRLQIQVLDDSTDATRDRVADHVARLREEGFEVDLCRRRGREGFKAGALGEALNTAHGELIAVFDADFVPDRGFLRRLVPVFERQPAVGMVQARWGFLNADANWLTRVQAWFLDAHFRVEQSARWRSGCGFNFNGTAGIWRRACIDDSGGWRGDTLTEDLDLSYRAQCAGWRFVYFDDEVAPSELPHRWSAFKAQQFRWAKGATQTARQLLPALWNSRAQLSFGARLEATLHLTANTTYVAVMMLMAGAALAALGGGTLADWPSGEAALVLRWIGMAVLAVALIFFAVPGFLRRRRPLEWRDWLALMLCLPVAIGLALNNSRAVLEGWLGIESPFQRTPKVGCTAEAQSYRSGAALLPSGIEAVIGAVFAMLTIASMLSGRWLDGFLLAIPACGFLWAGAASLVDVGLAARIENRRRRDDNGEKSVDISVSVS